MLRGVISFYANAVVTGIFSWMAMQESGVNILIGTNPTSASGPIIWTICRQEFPDNSTYCDNFDEKMNHAVLKISAGLRTMKLGMIRSLQAFDPHGHIQKQIDEVNHILADMEGQIASLHPASNLDELRAVISLVQKKLAQLYTTLDNVAKNATDELQPEIDGLIASVSTVCVSLFSLKLTIADIESRLKEVQIVDIVAKIISGPVPRYENDVFKKGNAPTVISTIVTLSYCEILKDVNHIFNLLDFLSLLENDIKLWGYQELYHAVLANGQLYNTAQPFIVANKIVGLAKNSNFIIAKAAMSFLSEIVHPIITPVVMQETALQFSYQVNVTEINHENGTVATLQDVTFIRKTSIRILNYGHIDDHLSIRFGCVIFVNDYTNMKVAYTLRHGNVLITRIVNEAGVDWDNQGDVLMWIEATCSFCSDCLKSMPTNGNTDMWQIFANKIACASYRVRVFGND